MPELERLAMIALVATFAFGCEDETRESGMRRTAPIDPSAPLFREVAAEVGLDFHHVNGATGEYYFPEIMGSGCALFDYDNDGDLDVYLVQGGQLDPARASSGPPPPNRLFRNDLIIGPEGSREIRFTDVTEQSGVGDTGYGMGVAIGDYDNDGFLDIYVTNFGPNVLYRNEGNGTFTDVSSEAGVADPRWGTSATFFDADNDGSLDLFVANYVRFSVADNKICRPTGEREYCHPSNFDPEEDVFYRNLGNGRFLDASAEAGIHRAYGSGLGVAAFDFNGDGWMDVYVANDGNENQLWRNEGNGSFEDVAFMSGAALNADGAAEAGMGVAISDFDIDGDEDIFLTHLRDETNTLYRNQGSGLFEDATFLLGLGYESLEATSFGVQWLDFDNDGYDDLFCANGAVARGEGNGGAESPYAEPNQLFRNVEGERFEDVAGQAGPALRLVEVSRGAAFGDVDNDGDVDILLSNNGGPARLLLNEAGSSRHWISIQLRARDGNFWGVGAQVQLWRGDGRRVRKRVHADGSYTSSSDLRVHFGLGEEASVEAVEVTWPGGERELFRSVGADRVNALVEGEGSPP